MSDDIPFVLYYRVHYELGNVEKFVSDSLSNQSILKLVRECCYAKEEPKVLAKSLKSLTTNMVIQKMLMGMILQRAESDVVMIQQRYYQ